MNNENGEVTNKKRIKSAHFDDGEIATVIPVSKKYDRQSKEESRKDAVEEFQSKRGTYIVAIVIGIIVFIAGAVLIWVGSHYELRDFFVLGPLVLCIGLGLVLGGIVFLCLSIRKSKLANTRIANGGPPGRVVDTPTVMTDQSFITSSDVTFDMASPPPDLESLDMYGSQAQLIETPEESHSKPENPDPNLLYSTNVSPEATQAVMTQRTSTPSGDWETRVSSPTGEVYVISLPNETMSSDHSDTANETSEDSMRNIPSPALYLEPGENDASTVTIL